MFGRWGKICGVCVCTFLKLLKCEKYINCPGFPYYTLLSSHSHILIMMSCLYDTAVFVTDEEYFKSEGSLINIQACIEKPFLFLMARSPSTHQQLLYSDERLSDILEKKLLITTDGIEINDIVRAFKKDHRASQFEVGQQIGGNYARHGCCINSN